MKKLNRQDLVYPELSYGIVGCAFEVHNSLGGGHHEKYFQRALSEAFKNHDLNFSQQVYCPLQYKGKVVGRNFMDFVVDDKIVVEIKKGNRYSKQHINQVVDYLKTNKKKLAILINFGLSEVSFKRIVNFDS